MQCRTLALVIPFFLGFAGLATPSVVHAQTDAALSRASRAAQLESLSRERVRPWAATTPRIVCAPAPLTERPMAAAEFARLRVAPLEAAFLDAATVKRTFATRGGRRVGAN